MKRLPVVEKDRLLQRVVQGDAVRIRLEMLHRFRGENAPNIPVLPRRTVADRLADNRDDIDVLIVSLDRGREG